MIYENNQGALTLSNKWSWFDFTSFSSVKLYPKYTIDTPNNYLFTMGCYGSGVSSGSNTNAMTLSWVDGGANVQTATNIANPSTYTTAAPNTLTVTVQDRRFKTQGMKAFYSFVLTSTQPLT